MFIKTWQIFFSCNCIATFSKKKAGVTINLLGKILQENRKYLRVSHVSFSIGSSLPQIGLCSSLSKIWIQTKLLEVKKKNHLCIGKKIGKRYLQKQKHAMNSDVIQRMLSLSIVGIVWENVSWHSMSVKMPDLFHFFPPKCVLPSFSVDGVLTGAHFNHLRSQLAGAYRGGSSMHR